jgi:hypothetical protein
VRDKVRMTLQNRTTTSSRIHLLQISVRVLRTLTFYNILMSDRLKLLEVSKALRERTRCLYRLIPYSNNNLSCIKIGMLRVQSYMQLKITARWLLT